MIPAVNDISQHNITVESGLLGYAGIAPPIGPSPSVVSTARDPPGAHLPISN